VRINKYLGRVCGLAVAIGGLVAVSQPADAAIISINTYLSGENLGNPRQVATIEATQQGGDVLFKVTNTLDATGLFERQLFLDYSPTATNLFQNTEIYAVDCGAVTPCNAPVTVAKGTFGAFSPDPFNFRINWAVADNSTRLTFGDMSFFRITNATVANFFQNAEDALINIQRRSLPAAPENVAQYVNGPAPIPLPAALPLLLAGLAGLGVIGWRRPAG
jgi:hypothetical protein